MSRPVDNAAVKTLAARIMAGHATLVASVSIGGAVAFEYRSAVDPRVIIVKRFQGRRQSEVSFAFVDDGVDVVADSRDILTKPAQFDSLEALAIAVLRHDRALAEQRAWEAAGRAGAEVSP